MSFVSLTCLICGNTSHCEHDSLPDPTEAAMPDKTVWAKHSKNVFVGMNLVGTYMDEVGFDAAINEALAQQKAENQKLLKQWNRDLDNWNQSMNDKKVAEALVAERDRQLVVLRDGIKNARSWIEMMGGWAQRNQLDRDAVCSAADNAIKEIRELLASTSSAAERVERRIGAKAILKLAVDAGIYDIVSTEHEDMPLRSWLCARANALDRPDGKEEGNG